MNFIIVFFQGFLLQIAENVFSRTPLSCCFWHFILGRIQSYISRVLWSTWYSKIVEIVFLFIEISMYERKNRWKKKVKINNQNSVVSVQPIVIHFVTRLLWKAVLQMCSYKRLFWKTWSKFTGYHPCSNVISIKWQLYWNHTLAWVFSCKFDAYFSEHLFIGAPLESSPCMVLKKCFLLILVTFTERNRLLFRATSMKCARFVMFALSMGKCLLLFYSSSF